MVNGGIIVCFEGESFHILCSSAGLAPSPLGSHEVPVAVFSFGVCSPWPRYPLRCRVTHTYPGQICASPPAKSNISPHRAAVQLNIFGLFKTCLFFCFFMYNVAIVSNTQSLNSQRCSLKRSEFILFLHVQTAAIHF